MYRRLDKGSIIKADLTGLGKQFLMLADFPKNNGNVVVKNSKGIRSWFNVNVGEYTIVKC